MGLNIEEILLRCQRASFVCHHLQARSGECNIVEWEKGERLTT